MGRSSISHSIVECVIFHLSKNAGDYHQGDGQAHLDRSNIDEGESTFGACFRLAAPVLNAVYAIYKKE